MAAIIGRRKYALQTGRYVVKVYARIAATLQEQHPDVYQGVGQNDLWIAAVAV